MDISSFLEKLKSDYSVTVDTHEDYVIIRNGIGKEIYLSEDLNHLLDDDGIKEYAEYTVRFATQHRHFDDIDDALSYVTDIVCDRVLAIEFFDADGRDIFGGEILSESISPLTVSALTKSFAKMRSELKRLYFEIHSFSGRYDTERNPVMSLPK